MNTMNSGNMSRVDTLVNHLDRISSQLDLELGDVGFGNLDAFLISRGCRSIVGTADGRYLRGLVFYILEGIMGDDGTRWKTDVGWRLHRMAAFIWLLRLE